MKPENVQRTYHDGICWVTKLASGEEVAGRDPQQVQRTANRVLSGQFQHLKGRAV